MQRDVMQRDVMQRDVMQRDVMRVMCVGANGGACHGLKFARESVLL
jgi:hypothetical protein